MRALRTWWNPVGRVAGRGLLRALLIASCVVAPAPLAAGSPPPSSRAAQTASGDVARGHAAFDRVCGRCHRNAERDIGPRLRGINWSEERVRTQVRQGHRTMRAIPPSRLPDAELNDVIAYLRTIHTVQ